jgi:hypothetical protein
VERITAFVRRASCVTWALALVSCLSTSELSPRHVNHSVLDRIDAKKSFPGVHFPHVPKGWYYVATPASGPGDSARIGSSGYDAVFWLSTNPLYDDPAANVNEILAMRKDLWNGEWRLGVEHVQGISSVTYLVDTDRDGVDAEIQKTSYRRLEDSRGEWRTFSLHGRWPRRYDHEVREVFDLLVATATYQ